MRISRKDFVNGPTYEIKADARSTSPVSKLRSRCMTTTLSAQRTFSAANALVKRCAKSNFFWPRSTESMASCFSAFALLSSLVSLSNLASKSATLSMTTFKLSLAALSWSFASARALRLGSTVVTTSWYKQMLITNEHKPAAALFLVMMISGLKCSNSVNCLTSLKFKAGILRSSTPVLTLLSQSIYSGILPRSCFLQASQDLSLILPFFCTITPGCTLASRTIVAANTSSTPGGFFAMVFASPRSFLSSVFNAAMACSTRGSAIAKSRSVDCCFSDTSA